MVRTVLCAAAAALVSVLWPGAGWLDVELLGRSMTEWVDRFIEELLTFDEREIAEHTIKLCDDLLKRIDASETRGEPHYPYTDALNTLKQWIGGVIKYHTLMFNYVHPLHKKVQEIEKEVKEADQKLTSLNRKSDVIFNVLKQKN